uniref:PH domain-containing protein n=1 Tax=Rhabditophanes sp. KR3021 TaxID=114890 RepID=A0AC35TWX0_9BILA
MLRKLSRSSNYSNGEDDETSGVSELSYSSSQHGESHPNGGGIVRKKWSTAFRVMQGLHRFKNSKSYQDNVSLLESNISSPNS